MGTKVSGGNTCETDDANECLTSNPSIYPENV